MTGLIFFITEEYRNATTGRDAHGRVLGVIGVGQDISERKQVEIEKMQIAQELQTFIDTANAPIFVIDAKGQVNEWNNMAAKITGFTQAEVFVRDLVRISSPRSTACQSKRCSIIMALVFWSPCSTMRRELFSRLCSPTIIISVSFVART
jgi:PAS domain-containing protein